MSQTKAQLIDPVDLSIVTADLADDAVTAAKLASNAVVNASVDASAAIAGTKISPNFGSQNTTTTGIGAFGELQVTSTAPKITFFDSDTNPDFEIRNLNGVLHFKDVSSTAVRMQINSDGHVDVTGNLDVGAGLDVTGAITGTGNLTIDTDTLHVDSTNNRVGIGTTSPSTKFEVQTGGGERVQFLSNGSNQQPRIDLIRDGGTDFSILNAIGSYQLKKGSNKIYEYASDTHRFSIDGTEKVRIDSSGRIGIGVTSPTSTLHLDASGGAVIQLQRTSSNASNRLLVSHDGTDGTLESTNATLFRNGGEEQMRIDSSGRVMVGTTSPQAILTLNNTGLTTTTLLSCEDTGGSGAHSHINLKNTTGDVASILTNSDDLEFRVDDNTVFKDISANEHMRLDSAGRLLIGTTTAGEGTADDLTIANSSHAGITIRSGTTAECNIFFADGTSGNDRFRGMVRYFHNADALAFNTSATERMRINSNGNVGIGTTSPGALLTLNQAIPELRLQSTNNNLGMGDFIGLISLHTSDGSSPGAGEVFRIKTESSSSIGADYTTRLYNRQGVGGGGTEVSLGNGQGSIYLSTNTAGNPTATVKMAVMASGNVGIGTTSPDEVLEVGSNSLATGLKITTFANQSAVGNIHGKLLFEGKNSSGTAYIAAQIQSVCESSSGTRRAGLSLSTAGPTPADLTEKMKINNEGDVGIGVSSPTAKLHIGDNASGTTDMLILHANADGAGENNGIASIKLMGDAEHAAFIKGGHTSNGNTILTFHTDAHDSGKNPQERMRILDDGGVLINSTTRPVVGREMLGCFGGSASDSIGIASTCSNNNGIPFFASNPSNSGSRRLMRFAAGSNGDTRGTILFNGSTLVYGTSSDYRLKKNVQQIADGITKLKQLNPITFDWIRETDNNNVMGFLAHEVQEVISQVVSGTKDAVDSKGNPQYQEINYGGLTPLLTAALKEAITKIETLETKVAALEAA